MEQEQTSNPARPSRSLDPASEFFKDKGTPVDYKSGLQLRLDRGWLEHHESGAYVKFMPKGVELVA